MLKGFLVLFPESLSRLATSYPEGDEQDSNTGQTHSSGVASVSFRVPCLDTDEAAPPSPTAAAAVRGAAMRMLFMNPKGHESAVFAVAAFMSTCILAHCPHEAWRQRVTGQASARAEASPPSRPGVRTRFNRLSL